MQLYLWLCFRVKEEVFWRNYFYRVSLVKQSAQLTALAAQQQAAERREDDQNRADPQSESASGPRLIGSFGVTAALI